MTVKRLLSAGRMEGAAVNSTVLVSSSGHQKTGISVALKEGRIRKLQPPASPDPARPFPQVERRPPGLGIIALIVAVAPQPFPAKIVRCEIVEIVVGRCRLPPGYVRGHGRPLRFDYREAHHSRLQRTPEAPKVATGDAGMRSEEHTSEL